jgi:hypothetical protein
MLNTHMHDHTLLCTHKARQDSILSPHQPTTPWIPCDHLAPSSGLVAWLNACLDAPYKWGTVAQYYGVWSPQYVCCGSLVVFRPLL